VRPKPFIIATTQRGIHVNAPGERSQSVWKATARLPQFAPLSENLRTDVCVVGAGISGMTTAYLLARAGKRVVVLDRGPVGGGETAQTTAHLSSAMDDHFHELEKVHGEEGARLTYQSHQAAIERIGQIAEQEGIQCDYERLDGYMWLAPGDTRDFLQQELEAAHRAGFADVELLERAPLGFFDSGPCLRFPRLAQFHPLRYLDGLVRAFQRDGGRIFTGSFVDEVKGGSGAYARTRDGFTVTADAVVVATNSPFNDRIAMHTKQAPYRSFVIGARVPAGSVPLGLYYDTLEFYHYVRLQRDFDGQGTHDLLIVGGDDHKTGQADDADLRYLRLEAWTRERFPMIEDTVFRWSGQVMEPADFNGFIGRNPLDEPNVFIATGDSGQGMTHGTIAGMLISDLILDRDNPWEELYDPSRVRISTSTVMEFAQENLNVAAQYADWLRSEEAGSAVEVAPGTGEVVQRGASKVAVYRDESGVVHERSAVCTHLGCVVRWNSGERSWDCPCHGSRFAPTGEVLNGPAPAPLNPVEPEST
jgi:glycine/D-amino acid oxidase-like deaminating enzyme/nitrite reductase/ring-hydroxylating ferredoxin subunit